MIKISNLTKKFDRFLAVDNLSLQIEKGEIFGFIGPNGAGKTTTIKMLTGVLMPTSGTIEIGGYDLEKDPVKAKQLIGYIPDDPYVYPELTGREFLYLVGRLFEVKNLEEKIKKLLLVYKLEKTVDGPFKDYSRGNKQKLTILAAFLHQPEILIIDEPMIGLDPLSVQITIDLFKEFARKKGSIFVSTHTLDIAEKICDRIGVIDQGRLIFEGTIRQLEKIVKKKGQHLEELFLKLTAVNSKQDA
ncbi:MAG TPA: ABC transporter ATP-binding protein [Candidatus Bathyarchaeia archaeon]|nr:ABC transporter ATP-binding protein [Candidatus Bathyarchaeia archaeon]